MAIFASPDNPTGASLGPGIVETWCEKFPETLFVIDEAYAEYAGVSHQRLLDRFENLLITRTFSKAWGLAGLRLGVILGSESLISWIQRVRSPYNVNTSALWAAEHLLQNPEGVYQRVASTMVAKYALIEAIEKRGYKIFPGDANFFLLALGIDAQAFCDFCQSQSVLIRNRSNQWLPPEDSSDSPLWGLVRVTVGSIAENQAFLDCLHGFCQSRTLMFDLDDTLVDTSQSFDVVVATLVEQYSKRPLAEGELTRLRAEGGFNDDWDATVELLRRRQVIVPRDEILQKAENLYLKMAQEVEELLVDETVLQTLSKRYRLFVVTGRMRYEYYPIWASRLDSWFEGIYCRDDFNGARPKPAPDQLVSVMRQRGLQSGFYIGNSVDDMRAAQSAQLIPIGVTHTQDDHTLQQAGALLTIPKVDMLRRIFLL